jgi:hypothetical protein
MQGGAVMSDKPFKLDVNLDDEVELAEFLGKYEPHRGANLARRLGFCGTGYGRAADALMNYAQNKRAAILARRRGRVGVALQYEAICDRIYIDDIQPSIECW